jgi:hypothetical protein
MRYLFCLILILSITASVSAQQPSRKFKVDAFDLAWTATILGDRLSTHRALSRCATCYELSPIKHNGLRIGVQFGVLGSVKMIEYYNPGHSTLFRFFKSGMVAFGTGVIIHNLRKGR